MRIELVFLIILKTTLDSSCKLSYLLMVVESKNLTLFYVIPMFF